MPKTYKNLFPQICDFDNLLAAYERARRKKQQTPEMYAFHSRRNGNCEIYVMNADGSGQTNLTNNSALDWYPSWGP